MTEDYFTNEEMKDLSKEQLCEILDYLEIVYTPKYSKARLIAILSEYQVSKRQAAVISSESETPRYSVRVRRIMESKGELRNDS